MRLTPQQKRTAIGRAILASTGTFVMVLIVMAMTVYPEYGPVVGTWWLLGLWFGAVILEALLAVGAWLAGEWTP